MCGIFGFAGRTKENGWTETFDILNALFLASECRGKDASGFIAMTEPYANSLNFNMVTDKQAIRASEFAEQSQAWQSLRHRRCSMLLGHVRLATHGGPAIENLHPFYGLGLHGRGLNLVANGIVLDHRAVAERYGLKLRGENDCEVLIRLMETFPDPKRGLDACLTRVDGSLAIAVLDEKRYCIWLACVEGRPLWLARRRGDRNRWFFASTKEILIDAFSRVLGKVSLEDFDCLFPVAENSVHCLFRGGQLWA